MEAMAPELWDMLGLMLAADYRQTNRRNKNHNSSRPAPRDADSDKTMAPPETPGPAHKAALTIADDADIEGASNPNSSDPKATPAEKRHALETIVSCND